MDALPAHILDIAVLVVLLISALVAFMRGFFREILSITAWVAAAFAGIYGYPLLAPSVQEYLTSPKLAAAVAGIAIGLGTLIAASLAGHYIAKILRHDGLGAVDRSLGFLFGLGRGAVLVSLALLAMQWLYEDESGHPGWLRDARSLPLARSGADMLGQLLPENLRPQAQRIGSEAQEAADNLNRARTFERLVNPPAKSDAPPAQSGYTEEQRSIMDRVIKQTQ